MNEQWITQTIDEACSVDYGTRVVKKKDGGEIYPVYGGGGATFRMNTYNREDCLVVARFAMSEKCTRFVKGKFFLNDSGLTLRSKQEALSQLFLEWFLVFSNDTIYSYGKGSAQKNLDMDDFRSMKISYPPSLSEQQRIVSLLDAEFAKIDALKANAEKNLQNAKDLFQAALKKELEPKEGWKSMLLGDFAKMKAGDFIKASDIHSDYYEGSFPCYGGNGLRGYVDVPNKEGEYCLIGRQGALCGNVHIANGVFRATEHAVVVEPYFSMPIKLVYYLLTALNLNKYSTGAAQPGLSVKNIAEKAMISIPPEEKYSIIAATLDGLSVRTQALQANYEKTLSLCDDLKQALLREAFNGEI